MVPMQIAALSLALAGAGDTALLDFSAPWCAPCRSMEGTMDQLEQAGYPIRRVNTDRERELASRYNVQNIPCFVLVVDGQEVGRLSGARRRDELLALFAQGGIGPGGQRAALARGQSPDPPARPNPMTSQPASAPFGATSGPAAAPERQAAPAASTVSSDELIASSVRLTIQDPKGSSYGSGTIIDARQGEALVLTCGHIFRDSQGQGRIVVDLCAPGAPQKLEGRLVSYDLKCDVALVSIRPGTSVRVAPVAPKGTPIARGDRVITVGCNNGGLATAVESHVTAIDKFLGPPNVQVAGLPVQGRSGGGLFNAQGQVIGVCNAADPTDHEGLYAALAAVQEQLDAHGLAAVYAPRSGGALASAGSAASKHDELNAAERAVLAEVHSRGDGAEVICIVRSLSNPQAKSEVITLDRASPAFLRQLAADQEAQQSRRLTSLDVRQQPATRGTQR